MTSRLTGWTLAFLVSALSPAIAAAQEQDGAAEARSDELASRLRELAQDVRSARAAGEHEASRDLVREAVGSALAPEAPPHDERTLAALAELGELAFSGGELRAAERAQRAVLEARQRILPSDGSELTAARRDLAATLGALGELREARALLELVVEARERSLSPDHHDLQKARGELAATMKALGDLPVARALEEVVLATFERTLPPEHVDLQRARGNLAVTMKQLGELEAARALEEAMLEVFERTLPAADPDLQRAREGLAGTLKMLGDFHAARELEEGVLEVRERALPTDHPDLQRVRLNLGATLYTLGDLHGARELFEGVLEVLERTFPPEHPALQLARLNLAATIQRLGDLQRARTLFESVLEVYERTLLPDHPDLQLARANLAVTLKMLGDLHGARALEERVLEWCERTLPKDHSRLHDARLNLAVTIKELGDLHGARVLEERVLEVRERTLRADHPSLQLARQNLGGTLYALGDIAGARAHFEAVVAVYERTLSADHPDLQAAWHNLALAMRALGDFQAGRLLEERTVAARERTLPPDHPDLQASRLNLAQTMHRAGDLHGAQALQVRALEVLERTHPAGHNLVQLAQASLAATLEELGNLDEARALLETVLEIRERTLPYGHPSLVRAQADLAATIASQVAVRRGAVPVGAGGVLDEGEARERCAELLFDMCRAQVAAARFALLTSSVREAEERCSSIARSLGTALSFAQGFGGLEPIEPLVAQGLVLSETTRAAGLAASRQARRGGGAEQRELRAELRAASDELAALAQQGATREEFHRARSRREAAERELMRAAREQGGSGAEILDLDLEQLVRRCSERDVLVGFRRFQHERVAVDEPPEGSDAPRARRLSRMSLGAFVLRAGGEGGEPRLSLVNLGSLEPIAELVRSWRAAIAATVERGIGLEDAGTDPVHELGCLLREAIWDPLLEHMDGAERVVVALDDVLHLVPLDALPLAEGRGLLGDRWRIETRIALWELLEEPRARAGGVLVTLGGAAFNSPPEDWRGEELAAPGAAPERVPQAPGAVASLLRGGAWERGFSPLTYTGPEAREVAALFEEVHGETPATLVLEGRGASRQALEQAAPRARYLHVATHGWFAPESIRAWTDVDPATGSDGVTLHASGADVVRGMSPMLLCGLAFAGANLSAGPAGRVPGLMTAEELSTLDLSGCELAVLSACDTNVGERRAGQGVASLQKALHMAGARSAITSLWRIPDEASRELMLDFYRRLWVEGKPKSQALWEAKMRLCNAKDEHGRPRYTTRDWAAWVLTGEPD